MHLLQIQGKRLNKPFADGVYEINPDGKGTVKTICDMTRDGGGWTLLVTSYTNNWTRQNVLQNNEMDPKLKNDYSILFKADDIKNSGNVKGSSFEYRLEADSPGKFKAGLNLNAISLQLNMGLMEISRSRFKQSKNSMLISWIYVMGCFVNFWGIFAYALENIVFLKGYVKFGK